jgi:RNA recognition motif-containing protein
MDPNTFNYYTNIMYSGERNNVYGMVYNPTPLTTTIEDQSDKPWTRASRDPSLIVKGTELFVGNLSIDTNEQDLYDVFRDCGEVIDVNKLIIFRSDYIRTYRLRSAMPLLDL